MAVNGKKEPEVELETPNGGPLDPPKPGNELFEGQAKSMKITRDVNPHQLMTEIDDRLSDRERFQVVAHLEDDDSPVSEENPLTLYIHGDADMRTVRGVVESHEKDDNYGLTDEEREINALKAKLKDGKDLPPAELNKLLRAML